MKFEEVLSALKEGKKIRKTWWDKDHYIAEGSVTRIKWHDGRDYSFSTIDFEDNCWEIVPDPAPKKVKLRDLTESQYRKWAKKNCHTFGKYCEGCPFRKVCCIQYERYQWWIKNKKLYSDKFLDQEIEIDEE